jgi:hypothetical protein
MRTPRMLEIDKMQEELTEIKERLTKLEERLALPMPKMLGSSDAKDAWYNGPKHWRCGFNNRIDCECCKPTEGAAPEAKDIQQGYILLGRKITKDEFFLYILPAIEYDTWFQETYQRKEQGAAPEPPSAALRDGIDSAKRGEVRPFSEFLTDVEGAAPEAKPDAVELPADIYDWMISSLQENCDVEEYNGDTDTFKLNGVTYVRAAQKAENDSEKKK